MSNEKLILLCPCGAKFSSSALNCETDLDENDGATLDCPTCKKMLVLKNRKILDFHEYLHAEDFRWPKDGKGTGYVEIGEGEQKPCEHKNLTAHSETPAYRCPNCKGTWDFIEEIPNL